MIGFSMGGIETWLAASVDERIKVAVPAIAVQSFRWSLDNDALAGPGGHDQASLTSRPRKDLGEAEGEPEGVPGAVEQGRSPASPDEFDCPSMLRLFAGRPLLIVERHEGRQLPLHRSARSPSPPPKRAYKDAGADRQAARHRRGRRPHGDRGAAPGRPGLVLAMAHEEVNDGFLILDKPLGITSARCGQPRPAVVSRKTRIGHAGTLDPLASGVLVLAIGVATRLVEYVQAQTKVYRAVVTLGGHHQHRRLRRRPQPVPDAVAPDRENARPRPRRVPGHHPASPAGVLGRPRRWQRAYRLARRGETVELAPRPVRIDRIDIREFAYPRLELEITCGKGTYIRSLARDLGQRLGVGGYLSSLRRNAASASSTWRMRCRSMRRRRRSRFALSPMASPGAATGARGGRSPPPRQWPARAVRTTSRWTASTSRCSTARRSASRGSTRIGSSCGRSR